MTDNTQKPHVLKRRIMLPDGAEVSQVVSTSIIPSTDTLINDAKQILESELRYYRRKSRDGHMLEQSEANILSKYIDVLIKLSREEREQIKHLDYSGMSDDEIKKLLGEIVDKKNLKNPDHG